MKLDSCWMMLEILIFWDMYIFCQNRPVEPVMIHQDATWVGPIKPPVPHPSRAALVLGLEGFLAARVGDSNWLPSPEALGWLSSVLSRLTVVREFCLGSIHCASVYSPKRQVETNIFNWGSQSLFAETMVSGVFILKNVKPKKLRQGSSLWTAKDSKTSGKPLGDATHGTWKLWMITMVDSALIWNYYTMICILYNLWTYIRPWKITTICSWTWGLANNSWF